jgi:hypothetical protein
MKYLVLCLMLAFSGCARPLRDSSGRKYEPYGLLDRDTVKVECADYMVNKSNVFWSVVGVATGISIVSLVIPVWLIGFDLYEPTSIYNCQMERTNK